MIYILMILLTVVGSGKNEGDPIVSPNQHTTSEITTGDVESGLFQYESDEQILAQALEYFRLAKEIEETSPSMSLLDYKIARSTKAQIPYSRQRYVEDEDGYREYSNEILNKLPGIKHKSLQTSKDDIWESIIYALSYFDIGSWISKNAVIARVIDSLEKNSRPQRAENLRQHGIKLARTELDPNKCAIELSEIAYSYIQIKDFEKALPLIEESLAKTEDSGWWKPYGPIRVAATYHLEKGEIKKVMELVRQADEERNPLEHESNLVYLVEKLVEYNFISDAIEMLSLLAYDDSRISSISAIIFGIENSSEAANTQSLLAKLMNETEIMSQENCILKARMLIAEQYYRSGFTKKANIITNRTIRRFKVDRLKMPYAPYIISTIHCLETTGKRDKALKILARYCRSLNSSTENINNLLDEYLSVAASYGICGQTGKAHDVLSDLLFKLDEVVEGSFGFSFDKASVEESIYYLYETGVFTSSSESSGRVIPKLISIVPRFKSILAEYNTSSQIVSDYLEELIDDFLDEKDNSAMYEIIDLLLDESVTDNPEVTSNAFMNTVYEKEYQLSIKGYFNVDFSLQNENILMDFVYFTAQKSINSSNHKIMNKLLGIARAYLAAGITELDEELKSHIIEYACLNEFTPEWEAEFFVESFDVLYIIDREKADETLDRLLEMPLNELCKQDDRVRLKLPFLLFDFRNPAIARKFFIDLSNYSSVKENNCRYYMSFNDSLTWHVKNRNYKECQKLIIQHPFYNNFLSSDIKCIENAIRITFDQDGFTEAWAFVEALKNESTDKKAARGAAMKQIAELILENRININFNETFEPLIKEILPKDAGHLMYTGVIERCIETYYLFGRKTESRKLINHYRKQIESKGYMKLNVVSFARLYLIIDDISNVNMFLENDDYSKEHEDIMLAIAEHNLEENNMQKAQSLITSVRSSIHTHRLFKKVKKSKLDSGDWKWALNVLNGNEEYKFRMEEYLEVGLLLAKNNLFDEAFECIIKANWYRNSQIKTLTKIVIIVESTGYVLSENQKLRLKTEIGYDKYFKWFPFDKTGL